MVIHSARVTNDAHPTHAKFGDSSQQLIANVMNGTAYHKFIGQNIANTQNLFQAGNVTVTEVLGKRNIVTDAPALYAAGSPNKLRVLALSSGAAVVSDGSDVITNIQTTNGIRKGDLLIDGDTFTILDIEEINPGDTKLLFKAQARK